jgi:rod shape-determining protein MreD
MSPHVAARLRLSAILLIGILAQTTIASDLRVHGVAPDLMLILSICGGLSGGPEAGACVGFVAGLLSDLFLTTPLGLSALTFCLIGFAVGYLRTIVLPESRLLVPIIGLLATGAGVALFVVLATLVGQTSFTVEGSHWLVRVAVIESLWSAVLIIPLSWLWDRAARGSAGAERLGRGRPERVGAR